MSSSAQRTDARKNAQFTHGQARALAEKRARATSVCICVSAGHGSVGSPRTDKILLVHFRVDSKALDARQVDVHDTCVVVRHEILHRIEVLELEDELVVPIRLADETGRTRAALDIRHSIDHLIECAIQLA